MPLANEQLMYCLIRLGHVKNFTLCDYPTLYRQHVTQDQLCDAACQVGLIRVFPGRLAVVIRLLRCLESH